MRIIFDIDQSGTFTLGDRSVKRLGYGAMQRCLTMPGPRFAPLPPPIRER